LLPSPAERQLARELSAIHAEIARIKAGGRSTQLDYSSLMGPLYVRDPVTGEVTASIGPQPDGGVATIPVGGPPPPEPSAPYGEPLMAGVRAGWNGEFVGGAARPSNFAYVVVHVGPTVGFITDPSNAYGTLTEAGTLPVVPWLGPAYIRLVGYNTSTPSVTGPASITIGPITPAMVVAQELLDGIVTEVKLADQAVSAVKVKLAAIGTAQIAGNAVTLAQLADGSVNGSKILGNAIAPVHLSLGAVTGPAIAAESVSTAALMAGAVTADRVAANTLTAGQIAANAIGTDELAANSVVAGKVAANTITGNEILGNSIGAAHLVAGAVQAGKIAAGAVTAGTLAAGAVTAGTIAVNAVTAGAIQAGSVTSVKFASEISVSNRFIAGNPVGSRAEMNGGGFEAWAGSLQTFDVDASTGSVMMLGTYKTAASGVRGEFLTTGDLQFYPPTGANFSQIKNDGTAGLLMRGPLASSNSGHLRLGDDQATLYYGLVSGSAQSYFSVGGVFMNGKAPVTVFRVDRQKTVTDGSEHRIAFLFTQTGGADDGNSILHFERRAADSRPRIRGTNHDVGIVFGGGAGDNVYCARYNDNPINCAAAGFITIPSSASEKFDVATIEAAGALPRLRQIRPVRYKLLADTRERVLPPRVLRRRKRRNGADVLDPVTGEPVIEEVSEPDVRPGVSAADAPVHIGFIAEELAQVFPEVVRTVESPGGLGIDYGAMVPFLVRALVELDARLDALGG
jgi:hypothetical protein